MIQTQSYLEVLDNSGAKKAGCIKILRGGSWKIKGKLGDSIVVSVKKLRFMRKVKKGEIHKGILVSTAKEDIYYDGSWVKSKTNGIILIDKKMRPLGTRLFSGPFSRKLNKSSFYKGGVLSLINFC